MATAPHHAARGSSPVLLTSDSPEWELVGRVLASRHFAKAPTLSAFLRYICERSLTEREHEITEHRIGVQVFGRPANYNASEDNIVRNYARQLRRRLADYFAAEGTDEDMQLFVPRGGYIPLFQAASQLGPRPPTSTKRKSRRPSSLPRRCLCSVLPTLILTGM